MKKAFSLFNIIAVIGLCTMFTSCNEDADTEISMTVSGEWQGNWGMYYEVEDPWGDIVAFDSYDTDIVFYPQRDYATYGYGYQVDWYRTGPYERLSYKFYWEINNGVIHMTYPGYPKYNCDIRDYRLNNNRFTGYFSNSTEPFYLNKIADYYNWSYYYSWDYHYWAYDSWSWDSYYDYYAKERPEMDTRATSEKADTTDTKAPHILKIGNRFAEK